MSTTNKSVATQSVTVEAKVEAIRPLATLESLVRIDGDKLTFTKEGGLSPSEMAVLIADRADKARTFGGQARWAWYSAGKLPNGSDVQAEIAKRLKTMMTQSALYQLTSEANTLCALIEAEKIQVPISLLKDAKAELVIDKTTGKFAPMKQQSKAARVLIPALKTGKLASGEKLTQGAIRTVREENKKPAAPGGAGGRKGGSAPTAEEAAQAKAILAFKEVQAYLATEPRLEGNDKQSFVNILVDVARRLAVPLK